MKRSASFGNQNPSSDRAKRRRTRSSDLVLQRRVSSLLEQAQSFARPDEPQNPKSDDSMVNISSDEFPCDADLEVLAAAFDMDTLSSDGAQMQVDEPAHRDKSHSDERPAVDVGERSDDLFDTTFDDLNMEELASLDMSSNETMPTAPQTAAVDEDEIFFEDGFDELMDLEMENPQTEVAISLANSNRRNP